MKKLIIAIDFDGVIAELTGSNIPGKLVKDADKYINQLHKDGHDIIIWTCRGGYNLYLAEQFLEEHKIHYDRINDNVASHYDNFTHNTRKVNADVYIDDKQVGGIPSWEEMYYLISDLAHDEPHQRVFGFKGRFTIGNYDDYEDETKPIKNVEDALYIIKHFMGEMDYFKDFTISFDNFDIDNVTLDFEHKTLIINDAEFSLYCDWTNSLDVIVNKLVNGIKEAENYIGNIHDIVIKY